MDYIKQILEYVEPTSEFEILDTILKIKQDKLEYYIEILPNGIIENIDYNYLSTHVVRVLKAKNLVQISELNAFDIYLMLDSVSIISCCTICGNKSNTYGKVNFCQKPECKNLFFKLATDDIVTNYYNNDIGAFNLLVLTAYTCLKHPHRKDIFNPIPPNFTSLEDIDSKIKYNFVNFSKLLEVVQQTKSDNELLKKIGLHDYSFLKFIIGSNITNLRSDILELDKQTDLNAVKLNIFKLQHTQINNLLNIDNKDVMSFIVEQDPITNKKFEGVPVNYLFHGSGLSNWFSILRNGIKVYSNTKMMTAGAAYGPGIYLSNTLAVSAGYGTDKCCSTNLGVYGVFQVLKPKSEYAKTINIFVVPNDNELVLRYIFVLKANSTHSVANIQKLNDYFINHKEKEVEKSAIVYNAIRAKRISYDTNKITKICEKEGWVVLSNNDNNYNKIQIEGKSTKICINYPTDYPSVPPHIWIVKTNRKINNPHLLKSGGVMNRELSYKHWEIVTELHKLLKPIIQSVSDDIIAEKFYDEDDSFKECTEVSKLIM